MMKILIAAGGTGGHLFPAIAVANKIKELSNENVEFHFFGRADKLEGRIIPQMGYKLHTAKLNGLSKFISINTLKLPFQLTYSIIKLISLIKRESIEAVICAGAYISYPAGIAASICNKKLFLMESNVNPGKTIYMLASKANTIYTTFDETETFFPINVRPKLKNFGNSVRAEIIENVEKQSALNLFELDPNKPVVLVFGGSLGAKSINQAMIKWQASFAKSSYQILWQTGNSFDVSNSLHESLPKNIKQLYFIDNMAAAYAVADLVVARSGATTVAELCITQKPSMLIPLPSASNNEQYYNATYLAKNGASVIVNDSDISEQLFYKIEEIMSNKDELEKMSKAAGYLAKPMASQMIAQDILEVIK